MGVTLEDAYSMGLGPTGQGCATGTRHGDKSLRMHMHYQGPFNGLTAKDAFHDKSWVCVYAVRRRLVPVATIVGGAGLPFSQSTSRGVGRRYIASGGQQVRQSGRSDSRH